MWTSTIARWRRAASGAFGKYVAGLAVSVSFQPCEVLWTRAPRSSYPPLIRDHFQDMLESRLEIRGGSSLTTVDLNRHVANYAAFFGCPPDVVYERPTQMALAISVARFPPKKVGALRRMVTPLNDGYVHMTCGMSLNPMAVPAKEARIYDDRIELSAFNKTLRRGPKTRSRCSHTSDVIHLAVSRSVLWGGARHSIPGGFCRRNRHDRNLLHAPPRRRAPSL